MMTEQEIKQEKEQDIKQTLKQATEALLIYKMLEVDIEKIIDKYYVDSYADFIKYNRNKKLENELNKTIREYSIKISKKIDELMVGNIKRYMQGNGRILNVRDIKITEKGIRDIIDRNWSGLHWRERIVRNFANLQYKLREKIAYSSLNSIKDKDLKKEIKEEIKKHEANTERLAITEDTAVRYAVDIYCYSMLRVKKVKYNITSSCNVCSRCSSNNGKIFKVGAEIELPLHTHCKCYYTPIFI